MSEIVLILILAVVLIFMEVFFIGGILGFIGVMCICWADYLAYEKYGLLGALIIGIIALCACLGAFLLWLYVLPKTKLGKKMYLSSSQSGKSAELNLQTCLNKEGITLTEFMPSGKVEIDGLIYDASSFDGASIQKNEKIKVMSANAFELKVSKI